MKLVKRMQVAMIAACLIPVIAVQLYGQTNDQTKSRPTSYWPDGVEFDSTITTPKEFLGFEIGQRHLDHAKLNSYLNLLAKESDRLSLQEYGKTHGGRPLLLLTITSKNNHSQIDQIRKRHLQLANPNRSLSVDTEKLPAVINMGYGVHGDEASATNCSALVAHYLASATGNEIETWLENCVILLDPCLNPDGFNRFANWVNAFRGQKPNPDPQHREHNQSWPSGRVNYYWFDLNRDWLPLEHPESRSRMRWYHNWKPNVVLDFHEMGTNSTYFFQPGVPNRTNPLTPQKNIELTAKFGSYHGKALDQSGSFYYTQERFDDFYMGKGSTYPDLHGAVGILFEQASARGHVQKNQDGRLTFHKAISNHFTTSLSSLRATSDLRMELLEYKKEFFRNSLEMAQSQKKWAFVFSHETNPTRIRDFARVLRLHDINCYWPKEKMELDGKILRPGTSLIVPLRQAEYRFLKSLLTRKKNFKENIFYDVSSWTLSLAYDLKQSSLRSPINLDDFEIARTESSDTRAFEKSDNTVAYLVDWQDDVVCRVLNQLLAKNINVKVATTEFSAICGQDGIHEMFSRGTLLVQLGVQPDRREVIEELLFDAVERGAVVRPVLAGLTPEGVDLGSSRFKRIEKPAIAMPVGSGIAQYEAGEIWHLLDKRHGTPISMLNSERFASYDLREYSTFVFPTGSYKSWSERDWEKIADEIKQGATAIAIGSSCDMVRKKLSGKGEEDTKPAKAEEKPVQLAFDSAAKTKALKLISGAIFKTRIDRTHPLFFGFPNDSLAVFRNHGKFLKPSDNPYCNPGIYDSERPHLAGYCSADNIEKFRHAASVVVVPMGKGRLIQISDNPNFRAFWRGSSRLFMNAIYFGAFTNP